MATIRRRYVATMLFMLTFWQTQQLGGARSTMPTTAETTTTDTTTSTSETTTTDTTTTSSMTSTSTTETTTTDTTTTDTTTFTSTSTTDTTTTETTTPTITSTTDTSSTRKTTTRATQSSSEITAPITATKTLRPTSRIIQTDTTRRTSTSAAARATHAHESTTPTLTTTATASTTVTLKTTSSSETTTTNVTVSAPPDDEFSSAWIALVVLGGLVLGSVVVFLILRLLQAIGQGGSAVPVAGFFRQPGAIPRQIVTSQPVGRYGDPKPGHMHWRRDRLGDIQRIPPTPTRADHIGHAARIQSGRQLGVSKVYWTNNNVTSSSPLPPRASGSVSALPGQHEQLEQTFPDFTSRHPWLQGRRKMVLNPGILPYVTEQSVIATRVDSIA